MFANTFNSGNQGGGGGLFGGQQNKLQGAQGGGLFQSFAPSAPQNPTQGGVFGQNQNQNTGGGLFGASNTGNSGFGASVGGQQNNALQGNSMFGQNQNQNQGGLFGQQQPQNNQGGAFGQTTQGGLFGQPQNQQNQSTGGIFGQSNPAQQQGGIGVFGQPQQQGGTGMFGQPQQQQGGTGLFGQTQGGAFGSTPQNNQSTGLFGAVSSTNNTSFMGAQQNQGGNLFGNTNSNQGSSPFGNPTNQGNTFGSNQQTTGLFGAPQQNTNTAGNSPFGGFGNNANANTNSLFGAPQQSNNNSTFSNPANKFGGTSWGVPTPAQPIVQGGSNFQPVRSKNIKLDAKHLVKCISALDQFQGCCKEEVRINFIQNGGQPPLVNQPNQTTQITQANQGGSMGFAKPQNNNGPLTSLPSFGGANTSLFGGQQQQNTGGFGANSGNNSLFGGTVTTGASNSLFGTNTQTQSPSFFGGQQPQQQGNSLFGGQPQQQQGMSLFGGQPQQQGNSLLGGQNQQQSSLFGGQPQQQQSSLFGGQPQQQQSSLFGGQPLQQQGTSLFGAQPQQQGTMFGAQPQQQGTMFGAQNPQGQGMSLFGASNPQTTGFPQGGTSLFNPSTPLQAPPSLYPTGLGAGPTPFSQTPQMQQIQPFAAPMPNPYNNGQFTQMISPLFQQQQQQMDPNFQLLLPQLLLGYALNQNQNPQSNDPSAQGNSTLDMINRLITNMSMPKPIEANAKNINTLLNPTPFDEFLKEESNSKWSERQSERRSLFSEAEIREFQDLDSRSYMDRVYAPEKLNQESYQLKHTYKPQNRKPDPLGESSYKVISRSYRAAQDQARKKYTPTTEELPQVGNYTITPSLERLKNMTINQLKKVDKVKISNTFGAIEFLQPISLFKLDIPGSIKIAQDNVQIVDPELEEKRVRMTFNNFGNYVNLKSQEQTKLVKKMRLWIQQFGMVEVNHDEDNGDLVVQTVE